jgi:aminodeoxyfutalosine deaminase
LAPKITYYKSRWVFPVDQPPIENGWVGVSADEIIAIGRGKTVQGDCFDLGSGVILPGLINAHTHLELSGLKGRIDAGLGFLPWVQKILALREIRHDRQGLETVKNALTEQHRQGIAAVGDWSTSPDRADLFKNSPLIRCGFHEIIGFSEQNLIIPDSMNKESVPRTLNPGTAFDSLGAHAPHTTSAALLKSAKSWTDKRGLPLSIHTAESQEEEAFLDRGEGPWAQLLRDRGRWDAGWSPPGMSPVAYLDSLGILNASTQCIHLTLAGTEDLKTIKKRLAQVVVCPRSNRFITETLPPLPEMLRLGMHPGLGTDSLASNQDLNLWKEMAFVHRSFPSIPPEAILEMATRNGAESLRLEGRLGSIAPGKSPSLLFLSLSAVPLRDLPAAILESRGENVQWIS